MQLLFELSHPGRSSAYLPACDVEACMPDARFLRSEAPRLPEVAEPELNRHYAALARRSFGICDGFYPLGSCTMKYNPRIHETLAALPGFACIHPLQPEYSAQGALELLYNLQTALAEITGMDAISLQPAAGAQGEFTGLLLIRAYHAANNDTDRTEIIVPDSAHGTNPASATMAGFTTVSVASDKHGRINLDALRAATGPKTAGLMLTNPNTLGLFDPNIEEICSIVHEAGGLCYYDGANLNPIMGIARPGDMGFDCMHVNLHKTFSTPHGGGGPGSGPVGCSKTLAQFLPTPIVDKDKNGFTLKKPDHTIGRVKAFHGNFGVCVRALAYITSLGGEGIKESARTAVLNANYLMHKLSSYYSIPFEGPCMHEFVVDVEPLKKETGVSALDVAKRMLDFGMHPPTMYFPLIVHEALMFEPTETESKEALDAAAEALVSIWEEAHTDAQSLFDAPVHTVIGRPDEVEAARNPRICWAPEA